MASRPGIVRKLDEAVVNRIAAGEVLQRPANAVKEMLENSLDAGATSIQVSVKNGGLKVLQIQDNGSGIRREDLPIVCHRFTTSKLKEFSDLSSIATYGFRGEALASITHVAHVTITTRTVDDKCAYRASYSDGELKEPPQPCAGTVGTLINVEDLFYNVSTRRSALSNANEEYGKIADVVSKYAIHNAAVGFCVKKIGEAKADVRTPPNSTVLDNLRTIYGSAISKEVVAIKVEDVNLKFKLEGYVTNANYSSKKLTFLLFINHRLVDSVAIRKGLEEIYSTYLPKHSHPFMYLSLELPPQNVDVNVHPTKHEVFFLHQDALVEKIQQIVDGHLVAHKSSRTFYTQTYLPLAGKPNEAEKSAKPDTRTEVEKEYAHDMVRTDPKMQKIDKFFAPTASNDQISKDTSLVSDAKLRREIKLTSVLELRVEVENATSPECLKIFQESSFVGCASARHFLFQHSTCLYLCNLLTVSRELFYQILLYEFGNFGRIELKPPPPIEKLARIAWDLPEVGWKEADGPKDEIAKFVAQMLVEKASMLSDYFSIEISETGCLVSLPLLLKDFCPDVNKLPLFLSKLATEVDWDEEQACFHGLSVQLAKFYADFGSKAVVPDNEKEERGTVSKQFLRTVENVLVPAFKKMLAPPGKYLHDRTLLKLANTKELYKVFERC